MITSRLRLIYHTVLILVSAFADFHEIGIVRLILCGFQITHTSSWGNGMGTAASGCGLIEYSAQKLERVFGMQKR